MGNFDSYKIAGSDSRESFGRSHWKHKLPPRYNLPAHQISPEEADASRGTIAMASGALDEFKHKKHLSKKDKQHVKELERTLVVNLDKVDADRRGDKIRDIENGDTTFEDGKKDFFNASDEARNEGLS